MVFLLLDLVGEVCRRTGVIIEPVYTGKSVHHLLRLTKEQPQLFKGNKILFIHTGEMVKSICGAFFKMAATAMARAMADSCVRMC